MAGLIIRPAGADDSDALCQLMAATPMGNSIRLVFDRQPDYFAGAHIQAEQPFVMAAFEKHSGRAVGVFSAGSRPVWVDGELTDIRYLSDLRIHPQYRNGMLMARGFKLLRTEIFGKNEYAQTLVLNDNAMAKNLLTSGRAGLPHYHFAGDYISFVLPGQKIDNTSTEIVVRNATLDDALSMQKLLEVEGKKRNFFPYINFSTLADQSYCRDLVIEDFLLAYENNNLIGFLAVWDQSKIRRIIINDYSFSMRLLRPFYNNFWARCGLRLPKAGQQLKLNYLSCICCRDWDAKILRALLGKALHKKPNKLFFLGLDKNDNLLTAVHDLHCRTETGKHYLVSFSDNIEKIPSGIFYFDGARI